MHLRFLAGRTISTVFSLKLTRVNAATMKPLSENARTQEIVNQLNMIADILGLFETAPAPSKESLPTPEYHDEILSPTGDTPSWSLSVQETHVRNNITGERFSIDSAPDEAKAYLQSIGRL